MALNDKTILHYHFVSSKPPLHTISAIMRLILAATLIGNASTLVYNDQVKVRPCLTFSRIKHTARWQPSLLFPCPLATSMGAIQTRLPSLCLITTLCRHLTGLHPPTPCAGSVPIHTALYFTHPSRLPRYEQQFRHIIVIAFRVF
ncbi:hypothetical protein BCV69DRAFT_301950 [Microstroma glucosiphilum]|uniref:Uncharacterized protein n=1 Tax=Pseudomicrostroma glucosiphilum TaxID=1684307 RepID=A0A316TZH5_9BASI|nr:hypothetical protein BCV69DRAFT_301950 [Pseudomicrostroma glucosiphilum]PWN17673.1 hypothetical protein BCV69DRAFT_301950 [Pseudomicrostroma glucosiphilum]